MPILETNKDFSSLTFRNWIFNDAHHPVQTKSFFRHESFAISLQRLGPRSGRVPERVQEPNAVGAGSLCRWVPQLPLGTCNRTSSVFPRTHYVTTCSCTCLVSSFPLRQVSFFSRIVLLHILLGLEVQIRRLCERAAAQINNFSLFVSANSSLRPTANRDHNCKGLSSSNLLGANSHATPSAIFVLSKRVDWGWLLNIFSIAANR